MEKQRPVLDIKKLVVSMKDSSAVLNAVDFELFPGEIHAVVSISASDQMYFEKVLSGEITHHRGQILIGGKVVKVSEMSQHVDVVDEKIPLFTELTLTENVCLNKVKAIRSSRQKERAECEELLKKYSIGIDINRKVRDLTYEEQLLIKVLRVYMGGKRVVVFSDSLSGLGIRMQDSFINILEDIKKQGRGVVYLTSRLEEAFRISDRISVMSDRRIALTKETRMAAEEPKDLMYAMSGWSVLSTASEASSVDAVTTIVKTREYMNTGNSLSKMLMFLAEDILKVVHGDRCLVCLANLEKKIVKETFGSQYTTYRTGLDNDPLVCEIIRENKFIVVTKNTFRYSALFRSHEEMNTLFCVPVNRQDHLSALLMVFFRESRKLNDTDRLYLSAFSREITIAIETAELAGRSTLLQESHHRIKNNLQMIISLVYMQKRAVRNQKTDANTAFDAVIRQISAIATVHNLLSEKAGEDSIINLASIIRELVKSYQYEDVEFIQDMENISIPYNKATTIAIVVNELLTNSIKYAFKEQREEKNVIRLYLHNDGIHITLVVADNGPGYPKGEGDSEIKTAKGGSGLGISLIESIVQASKGTVRFENGGGAVAKVVLPVSRVYDVTNSAVE